MTVSFIESMSRDGLGLEFYLYVFDVKVTEGIFEPVTSYVNVDTKLALTELIGEKTFVEFSQFEIYTDDYYPWSLSTKINGSYITNVRWSPLIVNLTNRPLLSSVIFTTNEKLVIYNRTVAKLTDAFSITGGFFSFLTTVCGILLFSYNSYVYSLRVAGYTFKEDDNSRKSKFTNIFYFFKYSVYSFVGLLGKKLNW